MGFHFSELISVVENRANTAPFESSHPLIFCIMSWGGVASFDRFLLHVPATSYRIWKVKIATVDGSEIPNNHLGCIKPVANTGINYSAMFFAPKKASCC